MKLVAQASRLPWRGHRAELRHPTGTRRCALELCPGMQKQESEVRSQNLFSALCSPRVALTSPRFEGVKNRSRPFMIVHVLDLREALWSAAACCRFCSGQLAGRAETCQWRPASRQASKLAEGQSGSKLPHSKAGFANSRRTPDHL